MYKYLILETLFSSVSVERVRKFLLFYNTEARAAAIRVSISG